MSFLSGEIPTTESELTRKAMEELQRIIGLFERGSIDEGAYRMAVSTLWQVTSGLVDKDTSHIISLAPDIIHSIKVKREVFA